MAQEVKTLQQRIMEQIPAGEELNPEEVSAGQNINVEPF